MIPEPHHPSDRIPHHPSTATDSDRRADGALHCNTALRKAAAAHRSPLSHRLCASVPLPPNVLSQSGRCVLSLSAIPRHCALQPPLNRSSDRSATATTAIQFPARTLTHRPLPAIAPTTNSVPMIPVSRAFPFSFSSPFSAAPPFAPVRSDRVHSRGRIASQISFTPAGEGVSGLFAEWSRSSWRRRLKER